jgi:vacuolar-type H+-ATPase subunit H
MASPALSSVADALLKVITDAVERKPQSIPEALALLEYIAQRDIAPLAEKLKEWAISDFKEEDKKTAEKVLEEAKKQVEAIETACGCFGK